MTGPSSPRIPQLDGLRGIAILLVVAWHYVVPGLDPASNALFVILSRFLSLTWSGVDLFFVLSGFLVGSILLDHVGSPNYYRAFFVRRAARILPLYFAWIGLYILIGSAFPSLDLFRDAYPIWTYLLFLQNIPIALNADWGTTWLSLTWSLAVEAQFYLVLPMFLRRVPPSRLPYALITLIGMAAVSRRLLTLGGPSTIPAYTLLPARMDALLLGVLCAWLVHDPSHYSYLTNHTTGLRRITGLMGATAWVFQQLPLAMGVKVSIGYSLLDLFYACFLLTALLCHDRILSRLTTFWPLTTLGALSYGIYILHVPVLELFDRHWLWISFPDPIPTWIALGCTVVLAWFSWQYFEKRFLAMGHRVQFD